MRRFEQNDYDQYLRVQRSRVMKKSFNEMRTKIKYDRFQDMMDIAMHKLPHADIKNIVCMGVKDGYECHLLKSKYIDAKVDGVELVKETMNNNVEAPNKDITMYNMDFNFLPEDWGNKYDLIYSNSIDHSFDIKQTAKEWRRILKDKGHMLLTLSEENNCQCDMYSFDYEDDEDWEAMGFTVKYKFRVKGQDSGYNSILQKC